MLVEGGNLAVDSALTGAFRPKPINRLPPEREAKLNAIGFQWDPFNERWEENFQQRPLGKLDLGHQHRVDPQQRFMTAGVTP
jgi:hypothetical protein